MYDIPAMFVIGRFRSGTTLVWNILRRTGKTCAYYEPFNDNLLEHLNSDTKPMLSHVGVDSYWDAYQDIKSEIPGRFDRRFGITRLCLGKKDSYEELQVYIEWLISSCKKGRLPVLQFNRADFRIPWLKSRFPDVPILYIYRDPREQWMSIVKEQSEVLQKSAWLNTGYDLLIWSANLLPFIPNTIFKNIRHSYDRHYILWKISYELGMQYADCKISLDDELHKNADNGIKKILKTANLDLQAEEFSSMITGKQKYKIDKSLLAWFEESESHCNQLLEDSGLYKTIKDDRVFDPEAVQNHDLSDILKNTIYPVCHEVSMHRKNAILSSREYENERILRSSDHLNEEEHVAVLIKSVKDAEEYAHSLEKSNSKKDQDIEEERNTRVRMQEEANKQIEALDKSYTQAREYAESLKNELDRIEKEFANERRYREKENRDAKSQIESLSSSLEVSERYAQSLLAEKESMEINLGKLAEARDKEQADSKLQIEALSNSMNEARTYTVSLEKERQKIQEELKNDRGEPIEKIEEFKNEHDKLIKQLADAKDNISILEKEDQNQQSHISSLKESIERKNIEYNELSNNYENYENDAENKIKMMSNKLALAEDRIQAISTEVENLQQYVNKIESNRITSLFIRLFRMDRDKSK